MDLRNSVNAMNLSQLGGVDNELSCEKLAPWMNNVVGDSNLLSL